MAAIGIALFCLMDALMKGLGLAIGAYSALLWRSVAGLGFSGATYALARPRWPAPALLRLHLGRGVVVAAMAMLWFYGITLVPLAEAVAISFIAPLIALFLAAIFLGERIGARAVAASLLGLGGVAVILAGKLGGDYGEGALRGASAILCSAILYAINLVLQRHQAQRAPPQEIAFFQTATVLICLAPAAPWALAWPDADQRLAIVGAAALAFLSLLLLSWAYARAEAQILVTTEYSGFIWLSILGWLFFGEVLTLTTVAGAVAIVAGCLLAARARQPPPPVETSL